MQRDFQWMIGIRSRFARIVGIKNSHEGRQIVLPVDIPAGIFALERMDSAMPMTAMPGSAKYAERRLNSLKMDL